MVALALKALNRRLLRLSTLLVWSLTKLMHHPLHILVVELSSATGASSSSACASPKQLFDANAGNM